MPSAALLARAGTTSAPSPSSPERGAGRLRRRRRRRSHASRAPRQGRRNALLHRPAATRRPSNSSSARTTSARQRSEGRRPPRRLDQPRRRRNSSSSRFRAESATLRSARRIAQVPACRSIASICACDARPDNDLAATRRAAALAALTACLPASRAPPSSASTPIRCTSKSTSVSGFPSFAWSACPTRACARAAIACARRSATPASSFRRIASPSTWRRPMCARLGRRSTCRSRWASSRPRACCAPRPHARRPRRRAVARRHDSRRARRAADRRGGAAGAARRRCCCRRPTPPRRRSSTGCACCRSRTLAEAVDVLNQPSHRLARGRRSAPPLDARRESQEAALDLRDLRGQTCRAARARSRGGRRPQPADDRPARAPARRCSRGGCRASCRRCPSTKRSSARPSIPSPALCRPAWGFSPSARFARRITRSRTSRWSAAAAVRGPARSASRTTACCSSTRCPSSAGTCSTCCASRSKKDASRSRAPRARWSFPARFVLVAAMNPCPCGYRGDPTRACRCTPQQVAKYRGRLSGPLLDRIDLIVDVQPVAIADLHWRGAWRAVAAVRARVLAARERQLARPGRAGASECRRCTGARSSARVRLDDAGDVCSSASAERLHLSARGFHRVLKVARTIADLAGASAIAADHLAEALQYRLVIE